MKKILAIAGSNSKKSINKILATYIANKIENVEVKILDWNEIELPLYSPDLEAENGIPENAVKFNQLIQNTDAIVLSLAEYNGLHTAAFKNLWDWASRIEMKFWSEKPIFLAATSPGARGGANVLRVTKELFPFFGGNIIVDFSLPSFNKNFQEGKIIDEELENQLTQKVQEFQKSIS
jgi:NAD(P)H-dependent FMN reductase